MAKKITVEWRHVTNIIFKTEKEAKNFEKNPVIDLVFDIDLCADDNETLQVKPEIEFPVRLEPVKDFSLERNGKICQVGPDFTFKVSIKSGKNPDDFDEWAYHESGDNCLYLELPDTDAEYEFEDERTYLGTKDILGFQLD